MQGRASTSRRIGSFSSLFYSVLMKKRMLVLDNSKGQAICKPVDAWSRHFGNVSFDTIHVCSGDPMPSLDRYTHLLLTDSEASLCHPEPWCDIEAELVRQAAEQGLAVLGSGFGHQMLAWALSGPDFIRPSRIPELGWVSIELLRADSLFCDVPSLWHVFAAHDDEVVMPPAPWIVLASNRACSVQAMRYGHHPIWGIQPRPEMTAEEARAQMEWGIDSYPMYAQQIRQAKIESPVRDDGVAQQLISAFLKSKPFNG